MNFNELYSAESNEWPTQAISSQTNKHHDAPASPLPRNTITEPIFLLGENRCYYYNTPYAGYERLVFAQPPKNPTTNYNCEYISPNDVSGGHRAQFLHPPQVPVPANTAGIHENSKITKEYSKHTPDDIYGSKPISNTGAYSFHAEHRNTFIIDPFNDNPKSTFSGKKKPNRDYKVTQSHPLRPTTGNKFNCPYGDCSRTGEKGFTRKDNLTQHRRNVHGEYIPKVRGEEGKFQG